MSYTESHYENAVLQLLQVTSPDFFVNPHCYFSASTL